MERSFDFFATEESECYECFEAYAEIMQDNELREIEKECKPKYNQSLKLTSDKAAGNLAWAL